MLGSESQWTANCEMQIAKCELRETCFWLRFIVKAELLPKTRMEQLLDEAGQLSDIVGKSVVTASGNQ